MRVASVRASAGRAADSGGRAREFHVAPMRDYTDRHHRRFTRLLSREAVLWSEMEKPGAILKAADASSVRKLDRLLQRGSDEGYEVFQIGGSDPVTVAAATSLVLPYGYDELNLNCGCPAITSGGGDYGASLMRRGGDDAARVIEAMVREAQKCDPRSAPKISVKCRVGIAETVGDVLPKHASKEEVRERLAKPLDAFVAKCADAGAASVVVHCRQAVMTGLSPSKNRGIPPLRPELVFELCSTRSTRHPNELEFILNGGVSSFADAANVFSSCPTLKGAQAGRWPLLRPFDVLHVDAFLTRVFDDAKGDDACALREEDPPTARVRHDGTAKERFRFAFDRRAAARAVAAAETYAFRNRSFTAGPSSRKENGAGAAARPLALALADLDDRLEAASLIGTRIDGESPSVSSENAEWTRQLDDPDALASALDGLLSVCGDLLEVDGGANRAKRTRKALAKAVGKKVGGKQRGTRAEAAEAAGGVASGRLGRCRGR